VVFLRVWCHWLHFSTKLDWNKENQWRPQPLRNKGPKNVSSNARNRLKPGKIPCKDPLCTNMQKKWISTIWSQWHFKQFHLANQIALPNVFRVTPSHSMPFLQQKTFSTLYHPHCIIHDVHIHTFIVLCTNNRLTCPMSGIIICFLNQGFHSLKCSQESPKLLTLPDDLIFLPSIQISPV